MKREINCKGLWLGYIGLRFGPDQVNVKSLGKPWKISRLEIYRRRQNWVIFFLLFGETNERPETDDVTSGPIRGTKKMHTMAQTDRQTDRQTDGHGDSMTESAKLGLCSDN